MNLNLIPRVSLRMLIRIMKKAIKANPTQRQKSMKKLWKLLNPKKILRLKTLTNKFLAKKLFQKKMFALAVKSIKLSIGLSKSSQLSSKNPQPNTPHILEKNISQSVNCSQT